MKNVIKSLIIACVILVGTAFQMKAQTTTQVDIYNSSKCTLSFTLKSPNSSDTYTYTVEAGSHVQANVSIHPSSCKISDGNRSFLIVNDGIGYTINVCATADNATATMSGDGDEMSIWVVDDGQKE